MQRDKLPLGLLMYPLSWLYGAVVQARNVLFDLKFFKSQAYDFPVIVVGNLTVGGTGKTPHTEYLISLLRQQKVAVLSRGYKRKTRGFRLATIDSTAQEIGDEPRQIKLKFPHLPVAVDGNRRRGIRRLRQLIPDLEMVLLDDAFQHRYVEPSLAILLMDFNRPIYEDRLLPLGNLREGIGAKDRAQVVIVTKTPDSVKPIDKRLVSKHLDLYPYQRLFFSRLKYGSLQGVFPETKALSNRQFETGDYGVVVLTGIASPRPLLEYLGPKTDRLEAFTFPDHHAFRPKDIEAAYERMMRLGFNNKLIITTEKDAVRMIDMHDFPAHAKPYVYFIPIEIEFLEDMDDFNATILSLIGRAKPIRTQLGGRV